MKLKDNQIREIRQKIQLLETILDGAIQQKIINRWRLRKALSAVRSLQTRYFPQIDYSLHNPDPKHPKPDRQNWKREKRKREFAKIKRLIP